MSTGPEGSARKRCRRFRIQLYPRVKVRCVGDARSGGSWERMQGYGRPGKGGEPGVSARARAAPSSLPSSLPSSVPSSAAAFTSRFRMHGGRMKRLRLGGSRRARLQQSLGSAGRWVVSVSGWAGVALRSKAKMGLAFLREALKLLITGLHAPSSEMSMAGYHIGPYLDEVLVHRRLEMHKVRRSKSLSSKSAPPAPRAWNQAAERIITFPGSRLARRRAPHQGLATIAESASEPEVRI